MVERQPRYYRLIPRWSTQFRKIMHHEAYSLITHLKSYSSEGNSIVIDR